MNRTEAIEYFQGVKNKVAQLPSKQAKRGFYNLMRSSTGEYQDYLRFVRQDAFEKRRARLLTEPMQTGAEDPDLKPTFLVGDPKKILFKESYRLENILNLDEEKREAIVLVEALRRKQDLVLKGPGLHVSSKEGKVFNKSEQGVVGMKNYLTAIEEPYDMLPEGSMTYSIISRQQVLNVAARLILYENAARFTNGQFGTTVREYFSLYRDIYAGDLGARIGDLTLIDFLDSNVLNRFAPHQIYQFMVRAHEIRLNKEHSQVLESNLGANALTAYPNHFIHLIEVATGEVTALMHLSPNNFDYIVGGYGGNMEVTNKARKVIEHTERIKQHIYETLLNPNSPHFPKLKETVEHYLSQDHQIGTTALNFLGLRDLDLVYNLYRRAYTLSKDGPYADFYNYLARAVKNYAEKIPSVVGVLTEDNLFSIIDADKKPAPTQDTPTVGEFAQIIGQMFAKAPVTGYEIDVDSINWYQMIPPQRLTLSFHRDTPRHFRVQFEYQNERGESLSLTVENDLRKNSSTWSFIETSAETPEFSNLNNSLLFITKAALLNAQEQAQVLYDQRQKDRAKTQVSPKQTQEKTKKDRPEPSIPRRADVVREIKERNAAEALTAVEMAQVERTLSHEIKKELIIPSVEERAKLVRTLSDEDQVGSFQELEEYNETQLGKFLPLKRKGPHGEILWSIDIASRVPGRIRGLATPVEFGDGIVRFMILDIDYRRNIYKKWHV